MLRLTVISTPTVDRTLVALKSVFSRDINCYCWQDFGNSENYTFQLLQLLGSIASSRFQVTLKARLSSLIVEGKYSIFQVLGSSEKVGQQECQLSLFTGFWQHSKQQFSHSAIEEMHSVFQVSVSSESEDCQRRQLIENNSFRSNQAVHCVQSINSLVPNHNPFISSKQTQL